jgi:hypothetical protein
MDSSQVSSVHFGTGAIQHLKFELLLFSARTSSKETHPDKSHAFLYCMQYISTTN